MVKNQTATLSEQEVDTQQVDSCGAVDLGLSGEVGKFMNLVTVHLMSNGFISEDDTHSMEPIFKGTQISVSDKQIVAKRVCEKVAGAYLAAYAQHCASRSEIISPGVIGQAETELPTRCPDCDNLERCDTSPHVFFEKDRMALRCRKCRHVWESASILGKPIIHESVSLKSSIDTPPKG